MPYSVRYLPVRSGKNWAKVNKRTGKIVSRHRSKAKALASIRAYYAARNRLTRNQEGCCHSHGLWDGNLVKDRTGGLVVLDRTKDAAGSGLALLAKASRRPLLADPTRTTGLVRRFEARLVSRFQQLKREVRKLFLEQAVLGPPDGPVKPFSIPVATPPTTVVGLAFEWEFLQDDAKVQAFKDWYAAQVTAQILFPSPDAEPGRPWTALYTDAAYRRGIINAFFASRRVASALVGDMTEEAFLRHSFAQGESTAKVRLLATRAYEGLAGITATVGTQLNRLLAQGLAEGRNPRQIARQMVETIDDIGIRRARTLARTEIIYAHAEGQLWAFEELGVEQLGIKAEWSTAGDDRVCPLCAAREGQVYKVSEAHGLIPLHPNCRCAWIPVVEDRN